MNKSQQTRTATGHIAPFGVRMQPELKERLEHAATAAQRSLNAEIVARLERSFSESADSAAVTALAYRLSTLDLQMEVKQMELKAIATRALHALLLLEDAINGEGSLPTMAEIDEWKAEALGHIKRPQSTQEAIQNKFVAMQKLAVKIHGAIQPLNSKPLDTDAVDDGTPRLPKASPVKINYDDLVTSAPGDPPKRRLNVAGAKARGELPKPAAKKSTKK